MEEVDDMFVFVVDMLIGVLRFIDKLCVVEFEQVREFYAGGVSRDTGLYCGGDCLGQVRTEEDNDCDLFYMRDH